ncbi:hypothetical protein K227x_38440 [Rubripirellula lacrimiformis]|uniref:Uncharacterized protein n=1 Tax=Rubripirellula lacrimiformis TaxID=1930273 RepID=A0A517NE90_9BACT|nr:hypothetical protein K227x_38440 [Rubripirellula lacrimiformis]
MAQGAVAIKNQSIELAGVVSVAHSFGSFLSEDSGEVFRDKPNDSFPNGKRHPKFTPCCHVQPKPHCDPPAQM